jgi:pimeloyl-ACP methyl ester carboxylesterase
MLGSWWNVPASFAAVLLALAAAAADPAELIPTSCGVPAVDADGARCYRLEVPLRRGEPDGRLITVPVVVIPGDGRHEDPIAYLRGGPGYPLDLDAAGLRGWRYRIARERWLQGRDLVLMEQRGQGGDVTLDCPEVRSLLPSLMGMAEPARGEAYAAAARACRLRWSAAGYEPGDFDTAAIADDLEDLRQALHVPRWNLYGISYGTRLALVAMHRHRAGLRAVILDSAYPPEDHFWESRRAAIDGAFDRVAADCAARPECPAPRRDLKGELMRQVAAYEAHPVPVTVDPGQPSERTVRFTGALLAERALAMLDEPDPALAVARLLQDLSREPKILQRVAQELADDDYGGRSDDLVLGRYFATDCREEVPFTDRKAMEADGLRHPWLADYGIDADDWAACAAWVDPDAKLIAKAPIGSDIPALVLQGAFDALTPPALGRTTAGRLQRGYFVEVDRVGHGVIEASPCARTIAERFLDNPEMPPDLSCLGRPAASGG